MQDSSLKTFLYFPNIMAESETQDAENNIFFLDSDHPCYNSNSPIYWFKDTK